MENQPKPSATANTEEPTAAQAEEAPAEAGLVDITSILGTPTVTIVWSSL
jgi:predicted secreted protein